MDFDFSRYVGQRRGRTWNDAGGARYAYSADIAMLHTFRRLRPVELAAAATVRMYKDVLKNRYLGTTTRLGPRQFPRLYRLVEECADALGVATPTVYVANNPVMNAYTYGTDEDSFIVVHSALIDHLDEDELKFVIGHETGHIQNKHVVYGTVLHLMKTTAAVFLRWVVPPAEVALQAWFRRAEITCDRAGLLCCKDPEAATRSFLKLACGSQKLYDELDADSYVEQLQEANRSYGRFLEAFASHPYIPKRIEALRVFAQSALFREEAAAGEGGLSMEEVDSRTSDIIRIASGSAGAGS